MQNDLKDRVIDLEAVLARYIETTEMEAKRNAMDFINDNSYEPKIWSYSAK